MKTIGNILWIIFGGGIIAILWAITGIFCCCTLVGIPAGIICFKFTSFVAWPFGKEIEFSNRPANILFNILWIIFFGWELAVFSLLIGLIWCITIVGIPFGLQCFKFTQLALTPLGAKIV